jgi:hypothetical protein
MTELSAVVLFSCIAPEFGNEASTLHWGVAWVGLVLHEEEERLE